MKFLRLSPQRFLHILPVRNAAAFTPPTGAGGQDAVESFVGSAAGAFLNRDATITSTKTDHSVLFTMALVVFWLAGADRTTALKENL